MSYINRSITESVKYAAVFYPVITLTGPRQSGKTTICKHLFADYEYVNLEDFASRELILADMKSYLRKERVGLIIDEAQLMPELFSAIQVLVDEDKSKHFVLSGSSNFSLLQSLTQSLAGRTALFSLLPFSKDELKGLLPATTDELLWKGFYPAAYSQNTPPELLYKNYYATYIERDVRQLIHLKNLSLFQTFIRLCAGRTGCEFVASDFANQVGVSVPTIKEWMSILQASYITFLLPPYFENIGKRLIKTPKLYFYDTGLVSYLLGIENPNQLATHPLRGNIFETMIVNEFLKARFNRGKDSNIYFYRDKSQNEVDVVQLVGNEVKLFEIKSAKNFNKGFFKTLDYLKGILNERVIQSTVIYDGEDNLDAPFKGIINFRNLEIE